MVVVVTTVFSVYGYPLEVTFKKLSEMGVKEVELGGYEEKFTTTSYWRLLKQIAKEYGIQIVGCNLPGTVGPPLKYINTSYSSGSDEWVEKLRGYVEICNEVGVSFITMNEGILPSGVKEQAVWSLLVETLRRGAEVAMENGILIVNEFHIDMFASTLEKAPKLISEVGSDSFKACLDLSHADLITGGHPEKFIRALGNIGHVHLTDCDGTKWRTTQPTHLPIGFGRINIDGCIQSIKKTGYKGYWSLCLYGIPYPEWAVSKSLKALEKFCL